MAAPVHTIAAHSPDARAAAQEALLAGGNALDAALAGYFALCGATSWALFAPMAIAIGGVGAGTTILDGRSRQPGRELNRPLRNEPGHVAPPAAQVSVPGSISAVSVAIALHARRTMIQLAATGVAIAKSSGAKTRAKMLARTGQAGTLVLVDRGLADAIEKAAPRIDGRLLTAADLAEVAITSSQGVSLDLGDERRAVLPAWCQPDADGEPAKGNFPASRHAEVILVSDGKGGHAGIVIEQMSGLKIFDGELEMPLLASPIVRGVPKLAPGVSLESPLAIALLIESGKPSGVTAARTIAKMTYTALTRAAASLHAREMWLAGTASSTGEPVPEPLEPGEDRLLVVGG